MTFDYSCCPHLYKIEFCVRDIFKIKQESNPFSTGSLSLFSGSAFPFLSLSFANGCVFLSFGNPYFQHEWTRCERVLLLRSQFSLYRRVLYALFLPSIFVMIHRIKFHFNVLHMFLYQSFFTVTKSQTVCAVHIYILNNEVRCISRNPMKKKYWNGP